MELLSSMIGNPVELHISGNIEWVGILIDYGLDVVVIYDGSQYVYIPYVHILKMKLNSTAEISMNETAQRQLNKESELSYRKILMKARGMFVQIVTGHQSVYGYVTNVMSNYFVLHSPVHRTLFVPMLHMKWLIPYPENHAPYSLTPDVLPAQPSSLKLANSFEETLKKMKGQIVVFDLGHEPDKIGCLKNIDNNTAELVTADQSTVHWNIQHLKLVSFLNLSR
ncbi:DUF2642 domain-containing protein [Cohnella pontilimi]|uniref:DUF2642 domain-containing protein n=1 Tax=Cohnella pontilimi TaxID=2564100 RepID=A0A4U0FEP9_9BACL|nr:DUF2642 domain-containing protein [Cohnella pontilimi]TJY43317.1 DUF2642 domain-containing protein [Cohnella pontilimi]